MLLRQVSFNALLMPEAASSQSIRDERTRNPFETCWVVMAVEFQSDGIAGGATMPDLCHAGDWTLGFVNTRQAYFPVSSNSCKGQNTRIRQSVMCVCACVCMRVLHVRCSCVPSYQSPALSLSGGTLRETCEHTLQVPSRGQQHLCRCQECPEGLMLSEN